MYSKCVYLLKDVVFPTTPKHISYGREKASFLRTMEVWQVSRHRRMKENCRCYTKIDNALICIVCCILPGIFMDHLFFSGTFCERFPHFLCAHEKMRLKVFSDLSSSIKHGRTRFET